MENKPPQPISNFGDLTDDNAEIPPISIIEDTHSEMLPMPSMRQEMYYGLVGQVMRAASENSEVHPAAAGAAFLSYCGVALGRKSGLHIGETTHHARIFTCHVGRSGIGGKGMALGLVERIRRVVEQNSDRTRFPVPPVACHHHDGGLSTREGLAWIIRDPSGAKDEEDTPSDPGVQDKRLWVVEEEFANLLSQAKRDGNTLSSALRTAFDGQDIAPATKTHRLSVTAPHIGLHTCITPTELRGALGKQDLTNGFANRFLYVWAERRGVVPFPFRTPDSVVAGFASQLFDAIEFATVERVLLPSFSACEIFEQFYLRHRRGYDCSEMVRGLTQRYPPYVWRLAMIFALLSCSAEIHAEHVQAAIAWLEYGKDSTAMIFSCAENEAQAKEVASLLQRILVCLTPHPQGLSHTELHKLAGKPAKQMLEGVLKELHLSGVIHTEIIPRPAGGRALRQYRLAQSK